MQTHFYKERQQESLPAATRPDVLQPKTKDVALPEHSLQRKIAESEQVQQLKAQQQAIQQAVTPSAPANGLPLQLKEGIENLSSIAMDDVRVHYNSSQPAQLNAHAYAQGNQIHLGPGQEQHLPHEAWHVVQQKQGRVQPTVQMKGKVQINDDSGLEREADVMGKKAMQGQGTAKPMQFKRPVPYVIQRKEKNLEPNLVQHNPSFLTADGALGAMAKAVRHYNMVSLDDKYYGMQVQELELIKEAEPGAYQKAKRILEEEKELLRIETEEVLVNKIGANTLKVNVSLEHERFLATALEKLQKELGLLGPEPEMPPTGEASTALPDTNSSERKLLAERIRINKEQLAREQEHRQDPQKELSNAQKKTQLNKDRIRFLNEQLANFGDNKEAFTTKLDAELNAVKLQMRTHALEASYPLVFKGQAQGPKFVLPLELIKQFNELHHTESIAEKLPILLKLQEDVQKWKAKHMDGDRFKGKYQGHREDDHRKILRIKVIEEQLDHAAKRAFHLLFSGKPSEELDVTTKKAPALLGIGKEALGMAATGARGSRFTGAGASSKGVSNALIAAAPKGVDKKVIDKIGLENVAKISEELNAIGAGANAIGQVLGLIELGMNYRDFKKDKLKYLATGANMITTLAAEVTMTGDNITKAIDGKGTSESTGWSESATITKGLAEGVFAIKNLALGIITIVKAYKRKGLDNEKMYTMQLQGGISLGKAVNSGMRTVQTALKAIHRAVPPHLLTAIPWVALVLDVIELIEAMYRTKLGYKYQAKMHEQLGIFKGRGDIQKYLDDDKMARKERRGVFAMAYFTRKDYQRFHPYLLSQLDTHPEGADVKLTEDKEVAEGEVRAGESQHFSKSEIKAIREYEYLSKMEEINQKRKMKGGIDAAKTLTNMVGDILAISHVGIIPGVALKTFVTAGTITHSVSKLGQKAYRDSKRSKLDGKAIPTSIEDYNRKMGGADKIDKSTKQKNTEYIRHSIYILDRIANLAQLEYDRENVPAMLSAFKVTKTMLKASGVDLYELLHTSGTDAQIKLIVNAMKSGR